MNTSSISHHSRQRHILRPAVIAGLALALLASCAKDEASVPVPVAFGGSEASTTAPVVESTTVAPVFQTTTVDTSNDPKVLVDFVESGGMCAAACPTVTLSLSNDSSFVGRAATTVTATTIMIPASGPGHIDPALTAELIRLFAITTKADIDALKLSEANCPSFADGRDTEMTLHFPNGTSSIVTNCTMNFETAHPLVTAAWNARLATIASNQ